jgi:hypothetical protein
VNLPSRESLTRTQITELSDTYGRFSETNGKIRLVAQAALTLERPESRKEDELARAPALRADDGLWLRRVLLVNLPCDFP